MSKEAAAWIENLKDTRCKCKELTQEMQKEFPELIRVRGFYHCPYWGKREHWWLKNKRMEIVDPTAEQFPSKGSGRYEEWIEGQPEPTGKCMNCGEYCFNGNSFCTDCIGNGETMNTLFSKRLRKEY